LSRAEELSRLPVNFGRNLPPHEEEEEVLSQGGEARDGDEVGLHGVGEIDEDDL